MNVLSALLLGLKVKHREERVKGQVASNYEGSFDSILTDLARNKSCSIDRDWKIVRGLGDRIFFTPILRELILKEKEFSRDLVKLVDSPFKLSSGELKTLQRRGVNFVEKKSKAGISRKDKGLIAGISEDVLFNFSLFSNYRKGKNHSTSKTVREHSGFLWRSSYLTNSRQLEKKLRSFNIESSSGKLEGKYKKGKYRGSNLKSFFFEESLQLSEQYQHLKIFLNSLSRSDVKSRGVVSSEKEIHRYSSLEVNANKIGNFSGKSTEDLEISNGENKSSLLELVFDREKELNNHNFKADKKYENSLLITARFKDLSQNIEVKKVAISSDFPLNPFTLPLIRKAIYSRLEVSNQVFFTQSSNIRVNKNLKLTSNIINNQKVTSNFLLRNFSVRQLNVKLSKTKTSTDFSRKTKIIDGNRLPFPPDKFPALERVVVDRRGDAPVHLFSKSLLSEPDASASIRYHTKADNNADLSLQAISLNFDPAVVRSFEQSSDSNQNFSEGNESALYHREDSKIEDGKIQLSYVDRNVKLLASLKGKVLSLNINLSDSLHLDPMTLKELVTVVESSGFVPGKIVVKQKRDRYSLFKEKVSEKLELKV